MSIQFESFAYKCFKTLKIVSFRSDNLYRNYLFTSKSYLKMNATLEQLKLRSSQANEVIEKLKKQVEQIKLQTTPAFMAEKAKSLQKENELLKKRVDELKKELEAAEAKKGGSNKGSTVKSESVKTEPSNQKATDQAKASTKTVPPKTDTKKTESKYFKIISLNGLFKNFKLF